jgi:hypothetical protein
MTKISKHQIGKPSTRLNSSDSDYWTSRDDPHDEWSIELLEIVIKTRAITAKNGGLPEAESLRIIRPPLKKKVRRKAA